MIAAHELSGELEAVRRALSGAPPVDRAPRPAPALDALVALFGLSSFERSLLVLCAGAELDSEISELCGAATPSGRPSFGLGLAVLPDPHWSALSPVAPLRRWRLVRVDDTASLTGAALRIEERILHLLAGVAHLDAELDGIVAELPATAELVPSHRALAELIGALLDRERTMGRWPVAHLCGGQAKSKLDVAAAAAAYGGLRLLRVDGRALAIEAREAAQLQRLCAREAALARAALVIDLAEAAPEQREAAVRFAEGLQAPLMIAARDSLPGLERGARFDLRAASVAERRELWRHALGESGAELNGKLDALVGHFDLEPTALRAAAAEALSGAHGEMAERVWQACRTRARPALDDLAQRIESPARWDDIVLPRAQRETLQEIAAQVRWRARVYEDWGFDAGASRGLGIAALFAGPTGTGKTLAAEVLANELALDLYRIDLSQVVSKYIGETEKNLRRVFDAAESGGAVLLFDEADALFGKRTEVKDSHDRFANIEVSYLLQRMEAYRGLAILTTNQRQALDEAFLRRLRFVVEFPFPEAVERAAIWERVFPARVPKEELDGRRLAQLAIPGANIRNVALGAAFLAADEGAGVRMEHLLRATRSEYAKLDRPLSGAELEGWE